MNRNEPSRTLQGNTPPSQPLRRIGLKLCLMLVAILVALLLGEMIVRIIIPQPRSWLAIYRRHPSLPFFALQPNVNAIVDTGETRWTVRTDENGFRIGSTPGRTLDRPLILFLGDSFSFGYSVDYEESFVGIVEDNLSGRRQVINASVSGQGPNQYLEIFRYLLEQERLKPETVVICTYVGNDFMDCVWNKDLEVHDGIVGMPGGLSLKGLLKQNSHLLRLIANIYHQAHPHAQSPDAVAEKMAKRSAWNMGVLAKAEKRFLDCFRELKTICQKNGVRLCVLVIPSMFDVQTRRMENSWGAERDHLLATTKAITTLKSLDIQHVDCSKYLTGSPTCETYFRYDTHLTAQGHGLVAEPLLEILGSSIAGTSEQASPR